MKKIIYLYPALLQILLFSGSIKASHLEGLWRNDRQNISIRIEDSQDGFRAKRLGQGTWYYYSARDDHQYYDRQGNYYEVWDENEIAWNEPSSGKRIRFIRVDEGNYDYRDEYGDEHWPGHEYRHEGDWQEHSYGGYDNYQPSNSHWADGQWQLPNGRYIESNRRSEIEIEWFRGGIRVKRGHGGWTKYYPDRNDYRYRDCDGHILQIIGHDTLRWSCDDGRCIRIYYRCH